MPTKVTGSPICILHHNNYFHKHNQVYYGMYLGFFLGLLRDNEKLLNSMTYSIKGTIVNYTVMLNYWLSSE